MSNNTWGNLQIACQDIRYMIISLLDLSTVEKPLELVRLKDEMILQFVKENYSVSEEMSDLLTIVGKNNVKELVKATGNTVPEGKKPTSRAVDRLVSYNR